MRIALWLFGFLASAPQAQILVAGYIEDRSKCLT